MAQQALIPPQRRRLEGRGLTWTSVAAAGVLLASSGFATVAGAGVASLVSVESPPKAAPARSRSDSPARHARLSRLEGSVRDEHGDPLVGALVSVFGSKLGGAGLIAFTDEQGRFNLSDLEPGLYMVRAYLSGFLPSHYSRVELDEDGGEGASVSMRLASFEEARSAASPGQGDSGVPRDAPGRDEVDPSVESEPAGAPLIDAEASERLSEYQWILRHRRRNILHQRDVELPEAAEDGTDDPDEVLAADGAVPRPRPSTLGSAGPRGEIGLFASAFRNGALLDVFDPADGLDSQMAFARLSIPTSPSSHWTVRAKVLESALSSWMANAEFVTDRGDEQTLYAGVAYGNHQYGDLGVPPLPYIGADTGASSSSERRTPGTEWFGSVYGGHRFRLGAAEVGTGLTYEFFSYLDRTSYFSPHLDVSWSLGDARRTVLRGTVDYRIAAPGGEDFELLARVVNADFVSRVDDGPRRLKAERTLRSQLALERRLGDVGVVQLRVFQEEASDPLLKAYVEDRANMLEAITMPGRFVVLNQGDLRTRGFGLDVSRRFGMVSGTVGYTFGTVQALGRDVGAVEVSKDEQVHDVTTRVQTEFDRTRTRVVAVYRLTAHPSLAPSLIRRNTGSGGDAILDSRFNVQVRQLLPFLGWNSTTWEVIVAVRNLFYEDIESSAFLQELSVVDSPKRVLGGVTVHF